MVLSQKTAAVDPHVSERATATAPTVLQPLLNNIPSELASLNTWVLYSLEPPKEQGGKWRKVPRHPQGWRASPTNSKSWSNLHAVVSAHRRGFGQRGRKEIEAGAPARVDFAGIGFVFDGIQRDDGLTLVGVDVDNCVVGGKLTPEASEIANSFRTYIEVSPSGAGIHILGWGKPVEGKNVGGLEIYSSERYFTFTGQPVSGFEDRQKVIEDEAAFAQFAAHIGAGAPRKRANATVSTSFLLPGPQAQDELSAGVAEWDIANFREAAMIVATSATKPFQTRDGWLKLGFASTALAHQYPTNDTEIRDIFLDASEAGAFGARTEDNEPWWNDQIDKTPRPGGITPATIFELAYGVLGSVSSAGPTSVANGQQSASAGSAASANSASNFAAATRQGEPKFRTFEQFIAEYAPLSYVVDGMIVGGNLYTLTARTGHGKTVLLASASIAIATGDGNILGFETKRGRVAYLTFENPDDFRMKLVAASRAHGKSETDILDNIIVCDQHFTTQEIFNGLKGLGCEFALVVIDTLQAAFAGKDFNDNREMLSYLKPTRLFAQLPGRPAIIIAAHPTKNAPADNIVPYGGGAVLNEVDGNLTLWRRPETNITELHWQGKFRGPAFDAVPFLIDAQACGLQDAKGRDVKPPFVKRLDPISAQAAAAVQGAQADDQKLKLLQAINMDTTATQKVWADRIGLSQGRVNHHLSALVGEGLVLRAGKGGKAGCTYAVTEKGRELLRRQVNGLFEEDARGEPAVI